MPFDFSAPFALFDDNLKNEGDRLFDGLLETLFCTGPDDLQACFAAIEKARQQNHWVVIAARYELGLALEPRLQPRLPQDGEPLLTAWVFRNARSLDAAASARFIDEGLARLDEHDRLPALSHLSRALEREGYCADVQRIRDWISSGDCYQINYTFPLYGRCTGHPLALYAALRTRQPVPYGAFVQHGAGFLLSRSPELFVERQDQRLLCRPMKGTAARETDPAALAASEKDRAENVMIVDLIRNDLGRLTPAGGVRVERLFDIEAYASLWQMTSTVSAAPVTADLLEILRALFPCGSITGAPKLRAMEIIDSLEQAPRGLYCGALGWLAPDGDFRFSVPIRTLEMEPDGRFRCGLGSGIVSDSDPAREWQECLLKGRFLTGLTAPFGLIETLRCDAGSDQPYPLLEHHLARLSRSATDFAFQYELPAIRAALLQHARQHSGLRRVRLELRPDGSFHIESEALAPLPGESVRIGISQSRQRSADPLLRHKTTARALCERVLQEADAAACFDMLLFNERDELTEGARCSVFIDCGDGPLLTPPLASGVLDGVMRNTLLESGRAREALINHEMLRTARQVYVANALRGLLRAELIRPAPSTRQ